MSSCAFADKNSEAIHSFYWAPIVYCEFGYLYGSALKFFLSPGRTGGLSSQSTKETARRLVAPLYGIQIIQAISFLPDGQKTSQRRCTAIDTYAVNVSVNRNIITFPPKLCRAKNKSSRRKNSYHLFNNKAQTRMPVLARRAAVRRFRVFVGSFPFSCRFAP